MGSSPTQSTNLMGPSSTLVLGSLAFTQKKRVRSPLALPIHAPIVQVVSQVLGTDLSEVQFLLGAPIPHEVEDSIRWLIRDCMRYCGLVNYSRVFSFMRHRVSWPICRQGRPQTVYLGRRVRVPYRSPIFILSPRG